METDFIKNVKAILNEKVDTITPSIAISEFTCLIAELLEQNIEFVSKQGLTPKAKDSRLKLIKLINIGETFNQLSITNVALKLDNRNLFIENNRLKAELAEIERQTKIASSI